VKPKNPPSAKSSQLRLFQARRDSQLNSDHPLYRLMDIISWHRFDEAYAPLYCEDNGALALPTRLRVVLEYLTYTYNLSDEELVARWLENPYGQYFCGETHFQTVPPFHDTSLGKWRLRIGPDRLETHFSCDYQSREIHTVSRDQGASILHVKSEADGEEGVRSCRRETVQTAEAMQCGLEELAWPGASGY